MEIKRVKKKFQYDGIELRIVEREEPYMNSKEPVTVTRVIAPNGGSIPYNLQYKETLKSIVVGVTDLLDSFKERGADIQKELTKEINLT